MAEHRVYLQDARTKALVEASLFDEVTDDHLEMWEDAWQPAMEEHCAGRSERNLPEDHHWDWQMKAEEWRPLLGYHSFAIVCDDDLQGLMLVTDFQSARLKVQFGKPLVYVEFVATAPWNRPEIQKPPRYRGVGTVMIVAAIELSRDLGYRGRIGLHSLPAAERFYRQQCGMTQLGKDAAHQRMIYYEMTSEQADKFRRQP